MSLWFESFRTQLLSEACGPSARSFLAKGKGPKKDFSLRARNDRQFGDTVLHTIQKVPAHVRVAITFDRGS